MLGQTIHSFALTGLAAPSGILGAETRNSYGWQEPQASSCLLPLVFPQGDGCPSDTRLSPIYIKYKGQDAGKRRLYIYIYRETSCSDASNVRSIEQGRPQQPAPSDLQPQNLKPPLKPKAAPVRSTGTLKATRRVAATLARRSAGVPLPMLTDASFEPGPT